jgi:hypothetical protein
LWIASDLPRAEEQLASRSPEMTIKKHGTNIEQNNDKAKPTSGRELSRCGLEQPQWPPVRGIKAEADAGPIETSEPTITNRHLWPIADIASLLT